MTYYLVTKNSDASNNGLLKFVVDNTKNRLYTTVNNTLVQIHGLVQSILSTLSSSDSAAVPSTTAVRQALQSYAPLTGCTFTGSVSATDFTVNNKSIAAQADWNQSDSTQYSYIKNKPSTLACKPFPALAVIDGTTLQLCNSLYTSGKDKAGAIFMGSVRLTDTPPGGQADLTVKIISKPKHPESPVDDDFDTVYLLLLNSTNTQARRWVTMYYKSRWTSALDGSMQYGTTDCPWFSSLMSPVDLLYLQKTPLAGGYLDKQYRAATLQYVDDAIVQADWQQSDASQKDYIKNKPYASLSTAGVIKIATNEQVIAGQSNNTAITPYNLPAYLIDQSLSALVFKTGRLVLDNKMFRLDASTAADKLVLTAAEGQVKTSNKILGGSAFAATPDNNTIPNLLSVKTYIDTAVFTGKNSKSYSIIDIINALIDNGLLS